MPGRECRVLRCAGLGFYAVWPSYATLSTAVVPAMTGRKCRSLRCAVVSLSICCVCAAVSLSIYCVCAAVSLSIYCVCAAVTLSIYCGFVLNKVLFYKRWFFYFPALV